MDSLLLKADRFNTAPVNLNNQAEAHRPFYKPTFTANRPLTTNTTCNDSSARKSYKEDSLHLSASSVVATTDGNILISGWRQLSYTPYREIGYLVKCTPYGDTLWVKNIASTETNLVFYYGVYELNDGGILLIGEINVPVPVNSRHDLILTKLSANGDFLWQRTFVSTFLYQGPGGYSEIQLYDLKSTPSGDIYFCGGLISGGFSRDGLAGRLNADGTLVWSKAIAMQGFTEFAGFNLVGNELQAYGDAADNVMFMASFNILTGDTVTVRGWKIPFSPNSYWGNFRPFFVTKLNNGNTIMAGRCVTDLFSPDPNFIGHVGTLEVSPTFDFVDAWRVGNDRPDSYYYTRIKVSPDGSATYVTVNGDVTTGYINVGKVVNGQVVKERAINANSTSIGDPIYLLPLAGGDDFIAANISVVPTNAEIDVFRMHAADTSGGCMGTDLPLSSIEHLQYDPYNAVVDSMETNMMEEIFIHQNYLPYNDGLLVTNVCKQISFCDSLKLTPSATTLCLPSVLNVDVYTNKECGGTLQWLTSSPAISQPVFINDTTVQIRFLDSFSGFITAGIPGCAVLKDSFFVMATLPQSQIDLGSDRVLCPGNTILLNAHNGYGSYHWQDGSTDSVFTVSLPGTYYVTATDACGNIFTDTVLVTAPAPSPFSAGPDRVKCNGDTLHLSATAGFSNYTWSNNYFINTLSGQDVIVSPMIDTAYYVKAANSSGCFLYDTVRIYVHNSTPVNLGADRQFCAGDSAILNAGPGFQIYQWSNSFNTQQITVKIPGEYIVTATAANGCKSTDTVNVLNPLPLPVVMLDKDTFLCMNNIKILYAGNFNSYHWNTGDTLSSIKVNTTGMYIVTVTDANGCKGNDTTVISTIFNSPSGFLPKDTAVCSFEELSLIPAGSFVQLLWNTGSSHPSITITEPATYWLEVKDDHGCIGRDSIIVKPKDCLHGFFISNAFTPNGDTKNDSFKPRLFGIVADYEFQVYNRWGQVVFHSRDLHEGWDGKKNGIPESTSVFTWICKYRFAGEEMKTRKGSVMIIR